MVVRSSDTRTSSKSPLRTSTYQQSIAEDRTKWWGIIKRGTGEYEAKKKKKKKKKKQSAKPSRNVHSGKPELRHHQQSFLPQASLVLSATGSLELRLVSSAILEHTNNNTSHSWLGLVLSVMTDEQEELPPWQKNIIIRCCNRWKSSNHQCRDRGSNPGRLHDRPTLYHVALKACLYRKAVQGYHIPITATYSPFIFWFVRESQFEQPLQATKPIGPLIPSDWIIYVGLQM